MAHRFNEPSPGRLRRSQTTADPTRTRWVEIPVSGSFRIEHERQQLQTSSDEEEMVQQPSSVDEEPRPFDQPGQRPWGFPPPPFLRLNQPEELENLRAPNDVPSWALARMKNREGFKRYVSYPTRLFHLRPQSNLTIADDLDWENTFLWHKASSSQFSTARIQDFPCPALDMPLLSFPEAILIRGLSIRLSKIHPMEALQFASAVLESPGRGPSDSEPDLNVPWRDVRKLAVEIVRQLEKHGYRESVAMADKIRQHQRAMEDYDSFFRFRDSARKPTGMGFRGSCDTFLLDDDYITDFVKRASQSGALSVRMRSDVKLISFLNSRDAAKVTTIAVSAQAFREQKTRTYLCFAIVRTFPNLERLRLTSIGTVDREVARQFDITPRWFYRFLDLQDMANEEIRQNGGSSFLLEPREDRKTFFDLSNMSPALIRATGAYEDGQGRELAGEPSRTPLVAFGIKAGLLFILFTT